MKRSEINQLILQSIEFFDQMKFKLPPWASVDNRFNPPVGRFPEIIEDEEPNHLLASDYKKHI